jgi:hypothetical protein
MHSQRLTVTLFAFCFLTAAIAQRAAASEVPWPPLRTAGPFLLDDIHGKTHGDWAEAWRSLYPAHRQWAPRATFVRCERRTPMPAELRSIRVVAVRRADVRVAGLRHPLPGVAVTVRVALGWYSPRDPITFSHTFHLVPVSGRWTWILSPERYRLYHDHGCLLGPAA